MVMASDAAEWAEKMASGDYSALDKNIVIVSRTTKGLQCLESRHNEILISGNLFVN